MRICFTLLSFCQHSACAFSRFVVYYGHMKTKQIREVMKGCTDPQTVREMEKLIQDSLKKRAISDAKKDPLGIVLFEDEKIVAIATKIFNASQNRKTGQMVQTYILYKHEKPSQALKTGNDINICGTCIHRGRNGKGRSCYVNLGHGPHSVWDAWTRGRYEPLNAQNVKAFEGKKVRLGTYGDPAFIPFEIWQRILKQAAGWTGYTHQWKTHPKLKAYCMASCDSEKDAFLAWSQGWRTFRVGNDKPLQGEIICPASDEAGKRTTCDKCGLCQGASKRAKSIFIHPHGIGKNNYKG